MGSSKERPIRLCFFRKHMGYLVTTLLYKLFFLTTLCTPTSAIMLALGAQLFWLPNLSLSKLIVSITTPGLLAGFRR